MCRFDYVKYDDEAMLTQDRFKSMMVSLESHVKNKLKSPRAKDKALAKLEEFYMWVGKAIRDDQIERSGSAPLQEERKDG